ncbi:MAG TPA: hypothetical protein ENI60_00310 [Candidatus Fraserbacteria bacterium]|nr:hypothetical protein [Candidatus Fraserbacteria bacterium]
MKYSMRTVLVALLSSVLLLVGFGTGGGRASAAPLPGYLAGSGLAESDIQVIHLTNLLTRDQARQINPGTDEALAIVVGICDGGVLNNTTAKIVPSLPGTPMAISGGLAILGCTPKPAKTGGADGLATGIKGGVITFSGPGAKALKTLRVYTDGFPLPPFSGGGDGILFQANELIARVPVQFTNSNGQAVARFGRQQDWIMTSQNLQPVYAAGLGGETTPLLLYFTVDIGSNAPAGRINVSLRLAVADDTPLKENGPCQRDIPINCGSNFLSDRPLTDSFSIISESGPPTSGAPPPPPVPISGLILRLDAGWNMISSPVGTIAPADLKGTCQFASGPWEWTGSRYIQANKLEPAKGYWLKVDNACTLQATGTNVRQDLELHQGWNLISSSKSWNRIGSIFRGCQLQSGPWWYDGSKYAPIDPSEPLNDFKGYWVKVAGSCKLFSAGLDRNRWDNSLLPPGPPSLAAGGLWGDLLRFLGVSQSMMREPTAAAAPLAISSIGLRSLSGGRAELQVRGAGIADVRLQLFSLNGRPLADLQGSGNRLRFRPLDRSGRPLANGVYLYIVTVRGADGQSFSSRVKKLVVLR